MARHAERVDRTRARASGTGVVTLGVASALLAWLATPLGAQTTTPTPAVPLPYHAPAIALAQPTDAGALPADKPVAVFRFVTGEATDPVDLLTFSVTVDGVERTALFQLVTSVVNGITSGEAWGPIADVGTTPSGPHDVRARICSMRGACAAAHASLSIVAPEQAITAVTNAAGVGPAASRSVASATAGAKKKHSVLGVLGALDKVLQAVHVLTRP